MNTLIGSSTHISKEPFRTSVLYVSRSWKSPTLHSIPKNMEDKHHGQAQVLKPPGAEKLSPNTNYNGVTLDVSAGQTSPFLICIETLLSPRVFH